MKYKSPLENIYYKVADNVSPIFYKLKFTPNIISYFSFYFFLISLMFLFNGLPIIFVLIFNLSYFLDCLDGQFARKYNLSSKFGCYLDHSLDIIKSVIIIAILVIFKIQIVSLFLICVLFVISSVHYFNLMNKLNYLWMYRSWAKKFNSIKLLTRLRYLDFAVFNLALSIFLAIAIK